jgi:hypothetical protein
MTVNLTYPEDTTVLGKGVELTLEGARKWYNELRTIFDKPSYVPPPTIPWPPDGWQYKRIGDAPIVVMYGVRTPDFTTCEHTVPPGNY